MLDFEEPLVPPAHAENPESGHRGRRQFVAGIAAATAAAQLPISAAPAIAATADDFSDIQHVVVVTMENRSFDHMLGWVPGAEAKQSGRTFTNASGVSFPSYRLPDTWNWLAGDPDHTYQAGRVCYANGAMDGFLRTETIAVGNLAAALQADPFPLGYFTRDQLPFYAGAADYFTVGDHYFSAVLGPTWPNRIYMHTGQTDRLGDGLPANGGLFCTLTTIWEFAAAAGVSASYYFSDIPYTALWGTRLVSVSKPLPAFYADAAAGNLPAISYVDAALLGEPVGLSNDDHPISNVANGQAFLNSIYNAVRLSPNWPNTLLIINYDEWGGFADHVPPPVAPVSSEEANLNGGGNDGRLGIRVPFILIGPRARRNARWGGNAVVKTQYDPNAILNFISAQFGLPGLGIRSRSSGTIATALLPREQADPSVPPAFRVAPGIPVALSARDLHTAGQSEHLENVKTLQQMATQSGFRLPPSN